MTTEYAVQMAPMRVIAGAMVAWLLGMFGIGGAGSVLAIVARGLWRSARVRS